MKKIDEKIWFHDFVAIRDIVLDDLELMEM
jgi:hypothetical protein